MPDTKDINTASRPLIALPSCVRELDGQVFHVVGEKYVLGALEGAGAVPVITPSLGDTTTHDTLLSSIDGLLLTGSPSNISPAHYDGPPAAPGTMLDPQRDSSTLPLIRAALAAAVPLLCICRGMQELNVALGGTLHQCLPEVPGRMNHDVDRSLPLDVQYATRHTITLETGGQLAALWPDVAETEVNSLHTQGIDRLAPGLTIEAVAPDQQIEAVRVTGSAGFALAVQWHPEWRVRDNPFYAAIFAAFAAAAEARSSARLAPTTP